ncbi:hypothetical protein OCUBac02_48870 (plasmid) [Bosea sp. ANAM02]|nr:hypothetical protein OCUBac02_48870 [Bosea sp. ANAM02]
MGAARLDGMDGMLARLPPMQAKVYCRAMVDARHQDPWTPDHERWYQEAIERYGAMCLWNAKPQRTIAGLRVIIERLKTYGDMPAWKLALSISEFLGDASGPVSAQNTAGAPSATQPR